METIHHDIIQILKQRTSAGENTVDTLTDIIPMSKEAAYRRLRGEIPFTLDEAVRICEKLNISLDQLIQIKSSNTFGFHLNSMFSPTSMDEFYKMMKNIIKTIEIISKDPHSFMYGAEYTLPFMFTPKYHLLSKIKLLKWVYQSNPRSIPKSLSGLNIPEKYVQIQKEYASKSQKIETTIILNKFIFSIFVRDMKFFTELGIISDEELSDIKKELLSLLDDLEIAATTGLYEKGGKAHIYISETSFDTTYIYVQANNYKACAIRIYGINHLSCENPSMCENQKTWIESLMRYSSLISESGELQRSRYFKIQREIVNTIR